MSRNVYKSLPAADGGNLNANESTVAIDMTNVEKATFGMAGAFGGGTATIEISTDGVTFVSSGLTLNANGQKLLDIPCKKARVTLAGAAAPNVAVSVVLRTLD